MKLNKLSLGVAALCGLAAAPAFAINASNYVPANAMRVYLSGATAQDTAVQTLLTGSLCTAGSLTRYTATNQFVYICTPNGNINTGGKTQLVVHKNSIGGSGQGVGPVNNGSTLNFLDLSLINGTTCPASTGAATTVACADTAAVFSTAVSQIGISDVEPSFFGGASTYGNLKAESLATVIFGLPVTTKVYQALQSTQGLSIGATDAANIPTLSQAQITSMFTQEFQTWSGLTGVTVGTAVGQLPDDLVYVARRVDTSGTQKTYEAVVAQTINGDPTGKSCYAARKPFVAGSLVADNTAATNLCDGNNGLVLNNSGSGQVQACLARFNAVNKGAIGVLTTEQVSTADWKHVRVNGLLPNYENVISGKWTYYGDATLNTRLSPTPDTNHANFITALKSFFAIAAAATSHPAFGNTTTNAGKAGLLTLKSVDPVGGLNPWTRVDAGGNTDNCVSAVQAGF